MPRAFIPSVVEETIGGVEQAAGEEGEEEPHFRGEGNWSRGGVPAVLTITVGIVLALAIIFRQ